jgi:hypothetical protein
MVVAPVEVSFGQVEVISQIRVDPQVSHGGIGPSGGILGARWGRADLAGSATSCGQQQERR